MIGIQFKKHKWKKCEDLTELATVLFAQKIMTW